MAGVLRFPAVEIGASVRGRDLDDAALAPVWDAAAALGVAVFVHPQAPVVGQERAERQNLTQVIGFPLETALCMTRVIFGGVLERWPTIRWCFAHGGGAFASIVARLDHGWRIMDEARAAIPRAWAVGRRDGFTASAFIRDLADRLATRVQLTTDGHKAYLEAVEGAFGNAIDYAMLVKMYEGDSGKLASADQR